MTNKINYDEWDDEEFGESPENLEYQMKKREKAKNRCIGFHIIGSLILLMIYVIIVVSVIRTRPFYSHGNCQYINCSYISHKHELDKLAQLSVTLILDRYKLSDSYVNRTIDIVVTLKDAKHTCYINIKKNNTFHQFVANYNLKNSEKVKRDVGPCYYFLGHESSTLTIRNKNWDNLLYFLVSLGFLLFIIYLSIIICKYCFH